MKPTGEKFPSFLADNVALLAAKNKRLAEIIEQRPLSSAITIFKTHAGSLTIKYQDILLHSLYDPEREAIRFIESQDIAPGTSVLVYGFGFGYHLRVLMQAIGATGNVFVLEPNLDILKAAFTLLDLRDLISDERFHLISGETEQIVALRFLSIIDRRVHAQDDELDQIIIHNPSFQCLPPEFEQFKNTFELLLIERRTPEVFKRTNIRNLRANIDAVLRSPGIKNFAHIFQGKPALFINAGPSLDAALPVLGDYCKRAVIFCCDTALPALMSVDITPDFVLTVDPQDRSADHFRAYYTCTATLLFTPTSAPEVVEQYRGQKIVLLQKGHSITSSFEHCLANKGCTEAGGSVSCIGLDILMQFGCDPIIFVGMDYSFPGGKLYSSHIAETQRWFLACHRTHTVETMHWEAMNMQKVIGIGNKYGEGILTYQTLYSYLRQLEGLIAKCHPVRFYNFLSHGAHITGAEDIFLQEELALLLPETIDKRFEIHTESIDSEVKTEILAQLEH